MADPGSSRRKPRKVSKPAPPPVMDPEQPHPQPPMPQPGQLPMPENAPNANFPSSTAAYGTPNIPRTHAGISPPRCSRLFATVQDVQNHFRRPFWKPTCDNTGVIPLPDEMRRQLIDKVAGAFADLSNVLDAYMAPLSIAAFCMNVQGSIWNEYDFDAKAVTIVHKAWQIHAVGGTAWEFKDPTRIPNAEDASLTLPQRIDAFCNLIKCQKRCADTVMRGGCLDEWLSSPLSYYQMYNGELLEWYAKNDNGGNLNNDGSRLLAQLLQPSVPQLFSGSVATHAPLPSNAMISGNQLLQSSVPQFGSAATYAPIPSNTGALANQLISPNVAVPFQPAQATGILFGGENNFGGGNEFGGGPDFGGETDFGGAIDEGAESGAEPDTLFGFPF